MNFNCPQEIAECLRLNGGNHFGKPSKTEEALLKRALSQYVKQFPDKANAYIGKPNPRTILSILSFGYSLDMVMYWVEITKRLPVPINLNRKDLSCGDNALTWAMHTEKFDIAMYLLEQGAFPDDGYDTVSKHTALMHAVFLKFKSPEKDKEAQLDVLIQTLLDKGAYPDGHEGCCYTPLQIALGAGDINLCKTLLKYGAEFEPINVSPPPIQTIVENEYLELKELFDEYINKQKEISEEEAEEGEGSFWDFIESEIDQSEDADDMKKDLESSNPDNSEVTKSPQSDESNPSPKRARIL